MPKDKSLIILEFILTGFLCLLPFHSFAQDNESDPPNRFRQPIGPITIVQEPLALKSLSIENLAKNSFQIKLETNLPSSIKVLYGKRKNNLSNRVSSDKIDQEHVLTVKNLKKKQTYYFKVVVKGEDNSILESSFYKIKTKKK